MIQVNGINHVVLHVSDVARAKKFYTELLGLSVAEENSWQVFLHCGQQQVALKRAWQGGETPSTPGANSPCELMGTICRQPHRLNWGSE